MYIFVRQQKKKYDYESVILAHKTGYESSDNFKDLKFIERIACAFDLISEPN